MVYVIAEAGVNHNGSLEIAKKLVDVAVYGGADAIKFQTFKGEESTSSYAKKAKYQEENLKNKDSQLEMIKKLELPFDYFKEIQKYCIERKIDFVSTPDGEESLNFLTSLKIPFIKVGSTEVTNLDFLKKIGETGFEIVLSTGMSCLGEVEKALNTIFQTGNRNIKLMHCTTDYPTSFKDVNLKSMVTMKEAFKVPVGFSDHTISNEAAICAVALGAEFIEKHITLNRNMLGPDHKASMESEEFREYVQAIRNSEVLLGNGIKAPTEREKIIVEDVRRSIVAAKDLSCGTKLEIDMIDFKRPGYGIKPEFASIALKGKLKRDLKKDEVITWEDIL